MDVFVLYIISLE